MRASSIKQAENGSKGGRQVICPQKEVFRSHCPADNFSSHSAHERCSLPQYDDRHLV